MTILDTIDSAIRDWQTSPDAMRCTPAASPIGGGITSSPSRDGGGGDWVSRAGEGDDEEFTPCGQFADITPRDHCSACQLWAETRRTA